MSLSVLLLWHQTHMSVLEILVAFTSTYWHDHCKDLVSPALESPLGFSSLRNLCLVLVWVFVQAPDLGDRRLPPPGTLLSVWFISYVLCGSAFQVEADVKRRVWWWPSSEKIYFNATVEVGQELKGERQRGRPRVLVPDTQKACPVETRCGTSTVPLK